MSPPPDWRSSADYAYLNELDPSELAWEFLRRNPEYQKDHRTSVQRDPDNDDANDASALRWGLRFRSRPESSRWRSALVLVAASRSFRRPTDCGTRYIR